MAVELMGKKLGMTRLFADNGVSTPVSVIQVLPNRITQIKSQATDGYKAVQLTAGSVKASRLNKAQKGIFAKAGVVAGNIVREFRVDDDAEYKVGDEIGLSLFAEVKKVDVRGPSKGKGFAGGVKRWNFSMQDATHGNSISHRAIGSTGQCQTPGRVFKGKKMAGQMGNKNVSVQALQVMSCNIEQNLLMVRGAIPGKTGADVVVKISTRG
jgi:large subunit ribosomal protein L3